MLNYAQNVVRESDGDPFFAKVACQSNKYWVDSKSPDEWSRWRRRFEQFRIASGLADSTADKQISTLLYCLGEDAESVLTSTNATEEDRKDYDKVLKLFDDFSGPLRHYFRAHMV